MSEADDRSSESSGGAPFEEFLRRMLGDQAGEEAARALREQGFDMSPVNAMFSSPSQMQAALGQFQYLLGATDGPVNWQMAHDLARQKAFQSGDPSLSASEAQLARQSLTVADLWLDAVTDFAPGPVERDAWTRIGWVEKTLPMWKRICEPVAANVSRALTEALMSQFGDGTGLIDSMPEGLPQGLGAMLGRTQEMMPKLAAMMFSMQIGQAIAALAEESFGSTDVGIPLIEGTTTALVVHNIGVFSEGLDIPFTEVQQFIAARECAHRRLFASVPWLTHDLVHAVEQYSAEIAIDTEAISEAAREIDPSDPESVSRAMSQGVFSPEPTPRQQAALERLETLLALVEGWVEVVTAHATAPYLPHAEQLREMMRRRRATGGPAEQMLGQLIGLEMRPRRARGAAKVFTLIEQAHDVEARDALWNHPDMVPTAAELDDPESFLTGREAAKEQDAEIDAALDSLLDGTLGWAEGLSPEDDPEAESLRRADLDSDDSSEDDESTKKSQGDDGDDIWDSNDGDPDTGPTGSGSGPTH